VPYVRYPVILRDTRRCSEKTRYSIPLDWDFFLVPWLYRINYPLLYSPIHSDRMDPVRPVHAGVYRDHPGEIQEKIAPFQVLCDCISDLDWNCNCFGFPVHRETFQPRKLLPPERTPVLSRNISCPHRRGYSLSVRCKTVELRKNIVSRIFPDPGD
jgi:hypothetical protein